MSLTPRTSYEFEFGLPSGDGEGGIEVLNVEGDVIGTVAPPWAVDANGDSVPTAYKLRDNILARTVEHAGAVYPVVADPSVTLGWRIYVWFDVPDDVSRSDYWLALLHGAGGAIGCGGSHLAFRRNSWMDMRWILRLLEYCWRPYIEQRHR